MSFEVMDDFCSFFIFFNATKTLLRMYFYWLFTMCSMPQIYFSHVVITMTNQDHYYVFILKIRKMRPREVKGLVGWKWSHNLFSGSSEEKATVLCHHTACPKFFMNTYHYYYQKAIFKNENELQTKAHFW